VILRVAPQNTPLSNRNTLDFNGDGISDLWLSIPPKSGVAGAGFNKAGEIKNYIAQFDGAKFSFIDAPSLAAGWNLLGAGDFNGRGTSSLVSRNTNEQVRIDLTLPEGVAIIPDTNGTIVRNAKSDWMIGAVGDLDGDGKADILWRYMKPGTNDSGVTFAWFMDGDAEANTVNVNEVKHRGGAPLDWNLVGMVDLNGDRRSNIIWVSPSGQVRGLTGQPGRTWTNTLIGQLPAGFTPMKLGDFDGDGRGDILLADRQGNLRLWLMNGTTITSDTSVVSVDRTWKFFGAGDLDGNGTMDIVWVKPDNTLAVWLFTRVGSGQQGGVTVIDNAGIAPAGAVGLEP